MNLRHFGLFRLSMNNLLMSAINCNFAAKRENQSYKAMRIGIYCSANDNIDRDYFSATEQLGAFIGSEGHSIVYGGVSLGLMECVAKAVKAAGGTTIGVVPRIIEERGRKSQFMDIEIPCQDLNDRKLLMVEKSDIAIALPGGIGTLDEVFNVVAAHTIGYHSQRVILYNIKGYWDALIALLDDMQSRGMIRGDWHEFFAVANSLDEIKNFLQ